ncbi:MAG: acyl-CoA/acyl-ACP dehydrogenase [Proteobacteria bacterium]|nr:acyl-CoA/acyl-ACP dehydrogenase [Pseudomonadota bacterium]
MNLDLNTEQRILKNSARDFLKKECPRTLIREVRDSEEDFPKKLWKKMAQLGWMGVGISEEYDGTGGDFLDLTILVEAMGEACLPAPFFSTVVVAGTALQLSSAEALKKELLPRIADGKLVFSFALIEPGNTYGYENIETAAVRQGDDFVLDGTKLFVEYAASSDFILTVARVADEGLGIFLVETKSSGVETKKFETLDYAKQCQVILSGVNVPGKYLLALGEEAEKLLRVLEERGSVAKCAEMLGGMQPALDMSVSYAKERVQFDVPIGTFQAVQHHCANMAIEVSSSRYITSLAAWKIAQGLPATKEAAMAKSYTNTASNRVVKLGHQIHAAISYCDEHDMHLFLRRCKAAAVAFGDADYQLEKVATELGL